MNKLFYVFGTFPVQSQAFAFAELESLKRSQIDLSILRYKKIKSLDSYEDYIKLTAFHWVNILWGMLLSIRYVGKVCKYVKKVIFLTECPVIDKIRVIALIPLNICLLHTILQNKNSHVHFFWSNWTLSLALFLSEEEGVSFSFFMGAYDLVNPNPLAIHAHKKAKFCVTHAAVNFNTIRNNGLDTNKFILCYRGLERSYIEHACSFSNTVLRRTTTFVIAARLISGKRVLETAATIIEYGRLHNLDWSIEIFGDGPLRPSVVDFCKSNKEVSYRGLVSRSQLSDYFAVSEFLILDSNHMSERLPNVVKEAMINGCIPLVSNTPGIEELVSLDEGVVFEEICEVFKKVQFITSNKDLEKNMRDACVRKIKEKFLSEKEMCKFIYQVSFMESSDK